MARQFQAGSRCSRHSPIGDHALNGVTYDSSIISKDHGQRVFHQSFEQFAGRMANSSRPHKGAKGAKAVSVRRGLLELASPILISSTVPTLAVSEKRAIGPCRPRSARRKETRIFGQDRVRIQGTLVNLARKY